ncbi:hypothetical protein [Arthrobacter pityocampae]|uniref:hypothetical protein n=1 Tax=Arthrobacter pityocampae TaxID=547334 RepID=UPI0011B0E534|nr:hypothetical protein [Arthrobacter pityocampae]
MSTIDATSHGIAVLDIHDGRWGIWQVSAVAFTGPLRATATNAVVSDGFDERAFRSLTYKRQILLTARAEQACDEPQVFDAPMFDPDTFVAHCTSWVDILQDMFWQENDRRAAYNRTKVAERKAARSAGQVPPDYQRQAPLLDIDWPACPDPDVWKTSKGCTDPVNAEALRVANGCIKLLNFWIDIENDRLRKSRKYLNGAGGPTVRPWPTLASEWVSDSD